MSFKTHKDAHQISLLYHILYYKYFPIYECKKFINQFSCAHTYAHTCTFIYTHLILNSTNHEKKTCFVFIEYIFKSKHLLLLVPIWPPHECMITIYLKIYLSFSIVLPGGSGHRYAQLGLIQFLMVSIQAMFR